MKTIIRTLTTIALISTIQCGYGTEPIEVTSWETLLNTDYGYTNKKTTDGVDNYTLNDNYSAYTLNILPNNSLNQNIKLIIPSGDPNGVTVTNTNYMSVDSTLEIENNGILTNDNAGYIQASASDSSITFSGSGDITNNGDISANASKESIIFSGSGTISNKGAIKACVTGSHLTFSGSRIINNYSNGNIFTEGLHGAIIEFTENSIINNNGAIFASGKPGDPKNFIIFSGGNSETSQWVTTSAEKDKNGGPVKDTNGDIIWGRIFLDKSRTSMTIGEYSILSFGDYGKFYSNQFGASVTLNGTIAIASINASVDTTKMSISGSGIIDMSPLRSGSLNLTTTQTFEDNNFFTFGASQQLPNIKLPFNCKFNTTFNLSNAASVSYTVLQLLEGDIDGIVIKKNANNIIGTYGDYAEYDSGVTLPINKVTKEYVEGMSLPWLISEKDENDELKYNKPGYYLQTNDIVLATDSIATNADHTYNFGFIGEKAVSITPEEGAENTKAIFKGDNSEYAPKDNNNPVEITLPNEVEFGANNSLFPFTQTYIKGTFTAGGFTNIIPAGAEVKFTSGFTLGAGHTLIVKGTLIG